MKIVKGELFIKDGFKSPFLNKCKINLTTRKWNNGNLIEITEFLDCLIYWTIRWTDVLRIFLFSIIFAFADNEQWNRKFKSDYFINYRPLLMITFDKDAEAVQFLQWALPKLHFRWEGFRKVRQIVLKRIKCRMKELGLSSLGEYHTHLETNRNEWLILDSFCRIPISRFYRDKMVFQYLEQSVFNQLCRMAIAKKDEVMRWWSIGCASGEEPYTLAIIWKCIFMPLFENLSVEILATDADPHLIHRAINGCYSAGSIKDLPEQMQAEAFVHKGEAFWIKEEFSGLVNFSLHDIREKIPEEEFYLILCRNVVLTYFDAELQRKILEKIIHKLVPGGVLVIGCREKLPEGVAGLTPMAKDLGIYERR